MALRKISAGGSKLCRRVPNLLPHNQSSLASTQLQPTFHEDAIHMRPVPSNKIPFRKDYSREMCDLRREWVEQYSGTRLNYISKWWGGEHDQTESLKGNIEMPIGTISVPVAVAGPLRINGENARGSFLAPLATTEGALVASVNRGATVLTMAGGVNACAGQQRMTRGPAFKTGSPMEAVRLGEWIKEHKQEIQENVICKFSRHAKLKDIVTAYDMEYVHALFMYETGDAAGQNATSVTTWQAINYINQQVASEDIHIKKSYIEGNMCGDKKATNLNSVLGRGLSVSAQAIVPERVLNDYLNITSDNLLEFYNIISRIGERTNMLGTNANIANAVAAIFSAAGQDIACVHEASLARVQFDKNVGPEGGIKASIYMPSLVVGTVGGGTNLPTQRECLEIMGCHGEGKVRKLGEIIASYCLALDLSTISAVVAGEFVNAHDTLGRNRPQAM